MVYSSENPQAFKSILKGICLLHGDLKRKPRLQQANLNLILPVHYLWTQGLLQMRKHTLQHSFILE